MSDIINQIKNRIPKRIMICLVIGMLSGLFTHAFILTNKLPMWDDMSQFRGNGMTKVLARWMLDNINWISGDWSVPWTDGFITILLFSIGACFVVSALELRHVTSVVLVPIVMLTYPGVSSILGFTFTSDSYAFGAMCACAGAYFIRRYKYGFIAGFACLVMSLGCYQAFLPVAISILCTGWIKDLVSEGKNPKEIIIDIVKSTLTVLLATVTYIGIANLLYPNMPGNNGVDEMGSIEISMLPLLVWRAIRKTVKYFIFEPMSFVNTEMHVANIACVVLAVCAIGIMFIINKVYKNVGKILLLAIICLTYPIVLSLIYVMAPDANVSMLMLYAYVIMYVLAIMMCEMVADTIDLHKLPKCMVAFCAASVIAILFVGHSNFIIDNDAYFRSYIAYERVKDYYSRIMTQVESQDGYKYGDKVAILGEFCVTGRNNSNPLSEAYRMDDEKYEDFSGIALEQGIMTEGARDNFLRIYLGIDLPQMSNEEKDAIRDTDEFRAMSNYPEAGCIGRIGDVWVVKLDQDWQEYEEEFLKNHDVDM